MYSKGVGTEHLQNSSASDQTLLIELNKRPAFLSAPASITLGPVVTQVTYQM